MLVKDFMTRHPIMISAEKTAVEAQRIMSENQIRHLPIVGDGKRLVGLITRQRLALDPDLVGSLNVWEITRHLSDLKVKNVMLPVKKVYTISSDATVERASDLFSEHKIGCLPVVEDENIVVGIITEAHLLKAFGEMLGLPVAGVRVTMRMSNKLGEFSKLMTVLGEQNWGVMGIGTYPAPRRENLYDVVVKIPQVELPIVRQILEQISDQEIIDIRDIV